MSETTIILIMLIVAAVLVAFVIAIWYSYKITRGMQEENRHLADLILKQSEEGKHHPFRETGLQEAAEQMQQSGSLPDEELLAQIEQQIEERRLYAAQDTSLKTLARELGLTQKRLNAVITASHYGSLNDMIAIKRVECVCRLLESKPEWTIEAISAEAGFPSRRTFQNLFKAHTGVTPTQYRMLKTQAKTAQ